MSISREYKGHMIHFSEHDDCWYYQDFKSQSLKAVMVHIDRNQAKGFKRFEAWLRRSHSYSPDFRRVTVTSVLAGGKECWVTDEQGGRGKEHLDALYLATPENDERVEEIRTLEQARKSLLEDIEAITKQMEQVR